MRMLALAEAWRERGGSVTFAGTFSAELAKRAEAIGCSTRLRDERVDDAAWTVEQLTIESHDVIVLDGYRFPIGFQRAVRRTGAALLVVDDNGENGAYDADWILNVNPHATNEMYARRNADAELLLGTSYVLLRRAFRVHEPVPEPAGRARKVLVTFGGADPPDATSLVVAALSSIPEIEVVVLVGVANPRATAFQSKEGLTVMRDVVDVAQVMTSVDLAVCGPSTTCWELGHLRVPTATMIIADNQISIADALKKTGATCALGDARQTPSLLQIRDALSTLINSPEARKNLVARMSLVSDGLGVERLVSRLREAK